MTGHRAARSSTSSAHWFRLLPEFRREFRRECGLAVYLGADAKHHPARIGLLGLLADPGTGLEIVLHGLMKGFPKGFHVIGVKADTIHAPNGEGTKTGMSTIGKSPNCL